MQLDLEWAKQHLESSELALRIASSLRSQQDVTQPLVARLMDMIERSGERGLTLSDIWYQFSPHERPMIRTHLQMMCERKEILCLDKRFSAARQR